jgi:uncharacterized protein (TIGR00369 family)
MAMFTPRDASWDRKVRESFDRQAFMKHLGARIAELAPGRVVLELDARAELTQQDGYLHAGVSAAIADSAGGYAAYSLFAAGTRVLSVEFKINLLAPARGARLRAAGEVLRAGRTLTVCRLEVHSLGPNLDVLCAAGQQTLICLPEEPDRRPESPE